MFRSKSKALLFVVCIFYLFVAVGSGKCRVSLIRLVFRSLNGERCYCNVVDEMSSLSIVSRQFNLSTTFSQVWRRGKNEEVLTRTKEARVRKGNSKNCLSSRFLFSKFGEIPPSTSFKFSVWFATPRTIDEDKNDRRSMQIQLQNKWDRFFKLFVVCFIHLVTTSEAKTAGYDG